MKLHLVAILAFLIGAGAAASAAPAAAAGKFAEIIKPYVDENAVAGAVFLVADAENTLACEAAGFADIAAQKPMRPDAIFWIASMTKPMTAACVMMLVDEGRLSLDDPVEKYIPEFAAPQKISPAKKKTTVNDEGVATAAFRKRPITLRHLLSHTAGMVRSDSRETLLEPRTLAAAAARRARLDLLFEPGASFSYSNMGISAAGRVVEVVSGIPYERFIQQRLLDPLGMTDTTFWPSKAQLARLATSYRGDPKTHTLTPGQIPGRQYPFDDHVRRYPSPSGGLFSTAADVAKFGQLLLNKGVFNGHRILSEKAVAEMPRRHSPPGVRASYGLCLSLGRDGSFGHSGFYGTQVTVWPREKRVTVYMVQRIAKYGAPDGEKLRPALEKAALEF